MDGHVVCARNLRAVWKTDFIPFISWRLFCPTVGIFPCCRTNAQNSVRKLCHVLVWHRIRFMCSFAMCRLLLGRFTALKSSLHIWVCWICVSHGLWWQVRIRAFGLRLNDDGLDSHLLRLPNPLFIRKNDHFPFLIISFPTARETVMLENIQNIFPNFRHIIIGITIQ